MNATQSKTRAKKMQDRAALMRQELWPDVQDGALWNRKSAAGFSSMPRTLPLAMNIIDSLTKGQPAGMAYLSVWCRLFEVGIVELGSEKVMSFESGFTGERAVDTWRRRMRLLKEAGFIDFRPGKDHDFQWVLVYNPYHVVDKLGKKVQEKLRFAWLDRSIEIGARDIDELKAAKGVSPQELARLVKAASETTPDMTIEETGDETQKGEEA